MWPGCPASSPSAAPTVPKVSDQISGDGTIAFATVTWSKLPNDMTSADAGNLIKAAESADRADLSVSVAGEAISDSEGAGPGLSVLVGVIAALVILLVVFGGAVFAALMPLLSTGVALVAATSVIGLITHALFTPSVASDLAILIGLGVGVDYGLFIISRHRTGLKAGLSGEDAIIQAVNTSGRTVLFAGATVCVALLGQFALGVGFLYGLSISSAVAVLLTMATSLTLLPALLGFLGPRVLSRRERAAHAARGPLPADESRFWLWWARLIEGRPAITALASLAVVAAIALPVFGLRLGGSDASTDPSGSTSRQAYNVLADGFGPGFNGPLELVGRVSSPADASAFGRFLKVAARTPGVASVTPAMTSPNGRVVVAVLYPATSPQAGQTVTLVNDLRGTLIPRAEQGTGLDLHVGGETATEIDFSRVLTEQTAVLHRRRRPAVVPAPHGRVPEPADPAGGIGHEPAVHRSRPGGPECGVQLGVGRFGPRPVGNRPDRRVHPGPDVLGAVRAVDRLRGVPRLPDPGGVDPAHPGRHAPSARTDGPRLV